ncbi:MAG: antibiotic biosynthesis monooxygenase [Candidatus Kapaibacteriales bacterium]
MIANTPEPPYYAVVFTAKLNSLISESENDYTSTLNQLRSEVENLPGFLGMESTGKEDEITVSYWKDIDDIRNWQTNKEHFIAKKKGIREWYDSYKVRICKVEKSYGID